MADGKPFSSGTEAEHDGQEFETAMRNLLQLEKGHLELWNVTQASVEALQKAHKRLPRDLASLQCTRTLPNEPKSTRAMRSEVDGAGTIRWQILDCCDWIVRPSSIDGDRSSNVTGPFCVVEMSINAKPFALKIYQLGKIAFMLSQGAKWRGKTTEVNKLFYIVITNRGKPILQPDKLLRRYSALNEAHADGRFGVIHASKYFGLGGATSTTVGAYALFFQLLSFFLFNSWELIATSLCIISIEWFGISDKFGVTRYLPSPARQCSASDQASMGVSTPQGLHPSAYMPQFKRRLFSSMSRNQKLLKKMPFNIIPPQVLCKSWCISFHCMISKTEHDEGNCCSWDVPPKLQDKTYLGKSWDRQCFVDWHFLCIVQEFSG